MLTGQARLIPAALALGSILLLLLSAACVPTSAAPGPTQSPASGRLSWTLVADQDRTQTQEEPEKAGEQASIPSLDCAGQDFLKKVRADYAANSARATREYVGERVCLKGKISDFSAPSRGPQRRGAGGGQSGRTHRNPRRSNQEGHRRLLRPYVGDGTGIA